MTLAAWVERIRPRRVPVVLQMTFNECGAACLAMVLGFHGRATPLMECRERFGVSRDGVNALQIAETARSYGLAVKAYAVTPEQVELVPLPAIAHWKGNHFVVVERWTARHVDIVDPAVGRLRLSAAEFAEDFSGTILTFEPTDAFAERRAASTFTWRTYLGWMLEGPGVRGLLAQVIGASLLLQLFGLGFPLLTKVLVDEVLPLRITSLMGVLGAGLLVLGVAQFLTSYLRALLLLTVQARFDARMMVRFFQHTLSLPYAFFQQRASGDLLTRLTSNLVIRETLTNQTLSAVLDGSLVLLYLAILFAWQLQFALLVLALGLLQVLLLIGSAGRMHLLTQRTLVAEAESHSYLIEALAGIATLKASGAEGRALGHWSHLFLNYLRVLVQQSHLAALIHTALTTFRAFAPLALLWVGAQAVLNGTMSLGTMLALNALAVAFLTPLASLVENGQQLQQVNAHLERIADVVATAPEQPPGRAPTTPTLTGAVTVRGVSFRYAPNAPDVLRDVSLTIHPGQKVALVGRTGSGKSTLALLLLGLYTPTEGEICYDDRPLPTLDLPSLRRQLGVVLQEPLLFQDSVCDNIAFNDPTSPLERVREAARLAAIHEEIEQLPMGYETLVSEGGGTLSGGQRQRLSLARALLTRPTILVLDEATSHLDVQTERQVHENLATLACTQIVIAHRLSTIQDADLIVVMDEGRIVEQGTHTALLAQGRHYATLIGHAHDSPLAGLKV